MFQIPNRYCWLKSISLILILQVKPFQVLQMIHEQTKGDKVLRDVMIKYSMMKKWRDEQNAWTIQLQAITSHKGNLWR